MGRASGFAAVVFVAGSAAAQTAPGTGPPDRDLTWRIWDGTAPPQPLWQLRFEPEIWYASPAGKLKLPGSPSDLEPTEVADLNLDSPRLRPAGELSLRRGPWRWTLAGSSLSIENSSTTVSTGQIGGLTFGIGDQLDSTFRLTALEATAGYRWVEARRGAWGDDASRLVFGVDTFAGLRGQQLDFDVSGPSGRTGVEEWFAEPIVGARLEIDLWNQVSVGLKVDGGVGAGIDDKTAASGAIEVGFAWRPWEGVGVKIGYRLEALGVSQGDGDEQLEFRGASAGLLFGATVRF